MASHGFGKGRASLGAADIAAKISEVKGVHWAHLVRVGDKEHDIIIFEFGHYRKFGYQTFDELLGKIDKTGIHDIEIYTIQESYKNGKPAEKE